MTDSLVVQCCMDFTSFFILNTYLKANHKQALRLVSPQLNQHCAINRLHALSYMCIPRIINQPLRISDFTYFQRMYISRNI